MRLDNPTTDKDSTIFPYGKRYYYPHMKPYDVAIWERFMAQFPDMYLRVAYDVCVGPGPIANPVVDEQSGGDVYKLYQRKIDVVAFVLGQTDIIELKPKAGPSAVGQVLFYKKLFMEDFKPEIEPKCVIITDELVAGMDSFCALYGVQLVVV